MLALDTQADRLAQARAKQQQREAGIRAQAYGEGRKAERSDIFKAAGAKTLEDLSMLSKVTEQHKAEMERHTRTVGKAAHRDGLFHGVLIGSALVVTLALGAFVILKETVILNTATQRVNYPNPPVLVDQYQEPEYARDRREPGYAP